MAWFRGWGRRRGCWRIIPQFSAASQSTMQPTPPTPRGYRYVGPCRCGFGPNAFYQDSQGRIVHASQVFSSPPATPLEWSEEETIEEKIERLREQVEELAEKIRETSENKQPYKWWPFKKQD